MRKFVNLASRILKVEISDDWSLKDMISVDEEIARELGVVFYNEKGFNPISDLRGDEMDDAEIYAIAKALELELRPEDLWQPIETAPMDGTFVDLWCLPKNGTSPGRIADARWEEGHWRGLSFSSIYEPGPVIDMIPTHWMPKPGAPR